jgi:hypothetical protein
MSKLAECCHTLYEKSCSIDKEKFRSPLELSYPKIFDRLDGVQKKFIKEGATDFVLLENANNFISMIKDIPNFLESIIDAIIEENKMDFYNLGSYTIPVLLKKEYKEAYPDADGLKYGSPYRKQTALYNEVVENIKDRINELGISRNSNVILHLAGELVKTDNINAKDRAGHYAIIIKVGTKVYVIDSMQIGAIDTDGMSFYTPFFYQVIKDVFNQDAEFIPLLYDTQPTGGFVNKSREDTDEVYWYKLQDMDSQNHFCYFWAIWFLHLYAIGGFEHIQEVVSDLFAPGKQRIEPLVVIKRYIWAIINYTYNSYEKLGTLIEMAILFDDETAELTKSDITFLRTFFMLYFRMVWYDLDTQDYTQFRAYSVIPCNPGIFRNNFSMNKCLLYSIAKNNTYVIEK